MFKTLNKRFILSSQFILLIEGRGSDITYEILDCLNMVTNLCPSNVL